jgi:hypothetical protein
LTLSQRLDAGPPTIIHGTPCSIATALSALPDEEAKALRRMLEDQRWTAGNVYDALTSEGIEVGRQSIGRHRRGDCRCPK